MSTNNLHAQDAISRTAGTIQRLIESFDLVDVEDAAIELGVGTSQVRNLCRSGRLGSYILSRFIITRQELDEFKKIPRPVGRPPI